MLRFSRLLDGLGSAQSRNRKLALLIAYFRTVPDPDRGWALAALTDGLPLRLPLRRTLAELMEARVDPVLYKLSRDYVGDTAETVSLLWPDTGSAEPGPTLGDAVAALVAAGAKGLPPVLAGLLDRLDASGRFALLKLIGGAPRVGVSARLAKQALADAFATDVSEIEELWHAVGPPYAALFDWLEGRGPRPETVHVPVFRPLMLANPIEARELDALDPGSVLAEWKWDGIRVEVAAAGSDVRIYSRAGDDISAAFPDLRSAYVGHHAVLDGELLIVRDGAVAPFNHLQQRLNRRTVAPRMLRDYPAHLRLYDMLFEAGGDLRGAALSHRRERLVAWHATHRPPMTDISPLIAFSDIEELRRLWAATREEGIEGLMLKRSDSPYLAGRPKGHWWKWKRAALTLDCVLMYAQRGSGKRSSFYSDYTFGVWRSNDDGDRELVPVGKAYSGFTDDELKALDGWIRANTVERFGPVRSVRPGLVLEVAFDALHPSARHKSGVAMRFPRIHRIRWDKPAEEADLLETAIALAGGGAGPRPVS